MMPTRRRIMLVFLAVGVALASLFVALVLIGWFSFERREHYFAPIFSADGGSVYFVRRDTAGIVWGFGAEMLTPPASAYAYRDEFTLRRIDLKTRGVEIVRAWPPTPIVGTVIQGYRHSLFGSPTVMLDLGANREVIYSLALTYHRQPSAETWGVWRGMGPHGQNDEWRAGYYPVGGYSEQRLLGTREVMELPQPQALAIVLYDHSAGSIDVLASSRDFAVLYSDEMRGDLARRLSQRKSIERVRALRDTQEKLVARFQREGLSEYAAILRADKELRRIGLLPPVTTMIARRLEPDEAEAAADPALASFDIAEAEMASGLFLDIEQAIAAPGMEVDKDIGDYVLHDDFVNSRRLNEIIANGATRFLVRYRGSVYEITIRHP